VGKQLADEPFRAGVAVLDDADGAGDGARIALANALGQRSGLDTSVLQNQDLRG